MVCRHTQLCSVARCHILDGRVGYPREQDANAIPIRYPVQGWKPVRTTGIATKAITVCNAVIAAIRGASPPS